MSRMADFRTALKDRVWRGVAATGGGRRGWIVVLCYHSIGTGDPYVTVPWRTFRSQIGRIRDLGIAFVGLGDLWSAAATSRSDREGTISVLLTFDDARSDFLEVAEFLREENVPSVLAVPGAALCTGSESRASFDFQTLTTDELRRVVRMRTVDVVPHGHSHRPLVGMSTTELENEVGMALAAMEELTGEHPTAFVYPYGERDKLVESVLVRHGIRHAFTIDGGIVRPSELRFDVPRFCVNGHTSAAFFELLLSRGLAGYMRMRELVGRGWRHGKP